MLIRGVGDFGEERKCRRVGGSFSKVTAHIRMLEKPKTQGHKLAEMNSNLVNDKALLLGFSPVI